MVRDPRTHWSICQNIQVSYERFVLGLHENTLGWTLTSSSHKVRSVRVRFAPIRTFFKQRVTGEYIFVQTANVQTLKRDKKARDVQGEL